MSKTRKNLWPWAIYSVAVIALTAFIIWITGSLWGLLALLALVEPFSEKESES